MSEKKPTMNHTVSGEIQSHQIDTSFYMRIVMMIIGLSLLVRFLFMGMYDLFVEEAYYWNYAQHLDFSYLDHPPMVALLIKITTTIFGTHEFGVRASALFCWAFMAFFSFKLTNLIKPGAGIYALLLLAILPYFFVQSLIMTPDLPLLVGWSGALYCFYRALVLGEPSYWYGAGVWVGIGLLSKYTICLLGPATLLYLVVIPSARVWLARKEPYLAALIALVIFTPVIYWNSIHEWASFVFQSTRRMSDVHYFTTHLVLGILLLFLTPLGFFQLVALFRKKIIQTASLRTTTHRFLQIYVFVPLFVFAVFSFTHAIKLTWLGPGLLAVIPWLAILAHQNLQCMKPRVLQAWLISGVVCILIYTAMLLIMTLGVPEKICARFFGNFFDWRDFTEQVQIIATNVEKNTHTLPVIIPLDTYNIASELYFYQKILLDDGTIQKSYPIEGAHYFDASSLMYKMWSKKESLKGRTLLLVARDKYNFDNPILQQRIIIKSPIYQFFVHTQGHGGNIRSYCYQVAEMR